MSCRGYEDQIGDYVDGTMNEAERASFESHLTSCLVPGDGFRLHGDSRGKPVARASAAPATGLGANRGRHRGGTETAARIQRHPMVAGVCACSGDGCLVAALSWTAAQLTPVPGQRLARVPTTEAEPVSILAEYQLAERDLTSTIEGLERIANSDRAALDMETADVLKANLTVLDGAIGESREALKKEPENDVAQQSLFEAPATRSRCCRTPLRSSTRCGRAIRKGPPASCQD